MVSVPAHQEHVVNQANQEKFYVAHIQMENVVQTRKTAVLQAMNVMYILAAVLEASLPKRCVI